MIEMKKVYYEEVRRILGENVPDCEVRVFGSRYLGTSKAYSDLDLAVAGMERIDEKKMDKMKDEFAESDIPFRVDILDLSAVSSEFRKVIENGYEIIQHPAPKFVILNNR
jgi:predicted nucleotidyltransferase